jgi:hypothetical protein
MVLYNSFRHTPDAPRFRAVLFTDGMIDLDAYKDHCRSIADRLGARILCGQGTQAARHEIRWHRLEEVLRGGNVLSAVTRQ